MVYILIDGPSGQAEGTVKRERYGLIIISVPVRAFRGVVDNLFVGCDAPGGECPQVVRNEITPYTISTEEVCA